eukprot:366131-Chlamydomonas_euryale.AAC.24
MARRDPARRDWKRHMEYLHYYCLIQPLLALEPSNAWMTWSMAAILNAFQLAPSSFGCYAAKEQSGQLNY